MSICSYLVLPQKSSDAGEYVTMTFEKGVPTSINGTADEGIRDYHEA